MSSHFLFIWESNIIHMHGWTFAFEFSVSWRSFPEWSRCRLIPEKQKQTAVRFASCGSFRKKPLLSGNRRFPFADWGNVCMSSRNGPAAATEAAFICLAKCTLLSSTIHIFPSCWLKKRSFKQLMISLFTEQEDVSLKNDMVNAFSIGLRYWNVNQWMELLGMSGSSKVKN